MLGLFLAIQSTGTTQETPRHAEQHPAGLGEFSGVTSLSSPNYELAGLLDHLGGAPERVRDRPVRSALRSGADGSKS